MTDKEHSVVFVIESMRVLLFSRKGVGMKLFEAVKEAVTARNAAEYYGIKVGRNGMAVCPFHPDKNPSMKLDKISLFCLSGRWRCD